MKIVIDPFDQKSIDRAIAQVKKYERDFEAKTQEFVKRLAEVGFSVAKVRFENALYAGTNDVEVRVEQNGNIATLIAEGEAVGFIEFGAGAKHPEWSGGSSTGYTPPKRGTYGKGYGNRNAWIYNGDPGNKGHEIGKGRVITSGNDPAEAMLAARNEMVEQITRIAREVWK